MIYLFFPNFSRRSFVHSICESSRYNGARATIFFCSWLRREENRIVFAIIWMQLNDEKADGKGAQEKSQVRAVKVANFVFHCLE